MTPDTPLDPPTFRQHWWRPLAFAAGLVGLLGLLFLLGSSAYRSPQLKADRARLAKLRSGNAVVLGSSHGFNVLPEKVGLVGENLAHGGQDLFEMAYMARSAAEHAPTLRTFFFVVSYYSFAFDNAAYTQRGVQTRIGRRIAMYSSFPEPTFISGDASAWLKGLLFPVVTRDHYRSVLTSRGKGGTAGATRGDLPPDPKKDRRVASLESLVQNAKTRCQQYDALTRNMLAGHRGLERDAYVALRDVSRELEQAGKRVVIVIPPYFETYSACFDRQRQDRSRTLAKRAAAEAGAEFVDASRDPQFARTREFFANSDHMNHKGKTAFSRWLGQELTIRTR